MSQLNVNSIKDRTGENQPDIIGAAKAFVNFNGTGTVAIRASYNVSSITDNGTGDYTVNFTTDMPDDNFCVTGTSDAGGITSFSLGVRTVSASNPSTTTSVRLLSRRLDSSDLVDSEYANISIFR